MKTRESLCLCDKEFVSALSAKIEKHFEDDKHLEEELTNYRRDKNNFIPDSQQIINSEIIDGCDATRPRR